MGSRFSMIDLGWKNLVRKRALCFISALGFSFWANTQELYQYQSNEPLEKIGKFSGSTGIYHNQVWNVSENTGINHHRDGHYTNAWLNMKFETHEYNGLKLGVAGWFSGKLSDSRDHYAEGTIGNAYNPGIKDNSALSELYLSFTESKTTLTIGRQEIWRQILSNNFDAVTLVSDDIDDLHIFAVYALSENWIHHDIVWNDFRSYWGSNDGTDDHGGVLGSEMTYTVSDNLKLTGFYYDAEIVTTYGGRVHLFEQMPTNELGVVIDYHQSLVRNNDWNNGDDGSIISISPYIAKDKFTLSAGYIQADDVTAGYYGSGVWFNDPYDPFKFGEQTRYDNARTWYLKVDLRPTAKLTISTIYGITNYGDGHSDDASEFNISATYKFNESVETNLSFVSVDEDSQSGWYGDFTQLTGYLKYSF